MAAPGPSTYTSKLKATRILIIGGTSGIGYGVAEAVLEHGASVIVASSSQERVDRAVQKLQTSFQSATADQIKGVTCRLDSRENLAAEVEKLFAEVARGGLLDHVVHTAGDAMAIGDFEQFSLDEIYQAGMVRYFSTILVAQHLRKHLKNDVASSYTMTTGGLSQRPRKGWTVMMGYLTALEGMSRALARDIAPIRVNLVGPGPVETELWTAHVETKDLEQLKADLARSMTTQKFGQVEDVVESYLYLMKDRNATGSIVYTNGGGLLT